MQLLDTKCGTDGQWSYSLISVGLWLSYLCHTALKITINALDSIYHLGIQLSSGEVKSPNIQLVS